jgi:AbrB family looped-hinge helix DNA binding protein
MNAIRVRLSESGRLSIPASFRKAVGLEAGGDVLVELEGKEIRIRSLNEAVAQAQAMARRLLAGHPEASVDDFIAERRREAEKE